MEQILDNLQKALEKGYNEWVADRQTYLEKERFWTAEMQRCLEREEALKHELEDQRQVALEKQLQFDKAALEWGKKEQSLLKLLKDKDTPHIALKITENSSGVVPKPKITNVSGEDQMKVTQIELGTPSESVKPGENYYHCILRVIMANPSQELPNEPSMNVVDVSKPLNMEESVIEDTSEKATGESSPEPTVMRSQTEVANTTQQRLSSDCAAEETISEIPDTTANRPEVDTFNAVETAQDEALICNKSKETEQVKQIILKVKDSDTPAESQYTTTDDHVQGTLPADNLPESQAETPEEIFTGASETVADNKPQITSETKSDRTCTTEGNVSDNPADHTGVGDQEISESDVQTYVNKKRRRRKGNDKQNQLPVFSPPKPQAEDDASDAQIKTIATVVQMEENSTPLSADNLSKSKDDISEVQDTDIKYKGLSNMDDSVYESQDSNVTSGEATEDSSPEAKETREAEVEMAITTQRLIEDQSDSLTPTVDNSSASRGEVPKVLDTAIEGQDNLNMKDRDLITDIFSGFTGDLTGAEKHKVTEAHELAENLNNNKKRRRKKGNNIQNRLPVGAKTPKAKAEDDASDAQIKTITTKVQMEENSTPQPADNLSESRDDFPEVQNTTFKYKGLSNMEESVNESEDSNVTSGEATEASSPEAKETREAEIEKVINSSESKVEVPKVRDTAIKDQNNLNMKDMDLIADIFSGFTGELKVTESDVQAEHLNINKKRRKKKGNNIQYMLPIGAKTPKPKAEDEPRDAKIKSNTSKPQMAESATVSPGNKSSELQSAPILLEAQLDRDCSVEGEKNVSDTPADLTEAAKQDVSETEQKDPPSTKKRKNKRKKLAKQKVEVKEEDQEPLAEAQDTTEEDQKMSQLKSQFADIFMPRWCQ